MFGSSASASICDGALCSSYPLAELLPAWRTSRLMSINPEKLLKYVKLPAVTPYSSIVGVDMAE